MHGFLTTFCHKTSWCGSSSSKRVSYFVERIIVTSASGKPKKKLPFARNPLLNIYGQDKRSKINWMCVCKEKLQDRNIQPLAIFNENST